MDLHQIFDFLLLIGSILGSFIICQKMRLSFSIGYLLVGMVLGPLGVGLFTKTPFLTMMSHVGLLLFLFTVGLEIPFHRIQALRRYIFGFGMVQVALTALILGAVFSAFLPLRHAVILALALSFSSTAVVVQMLSERHELTTQLGRTALSILLFQDIVAIGIFVFMAVSQMADCTGLDHAMSGVPLDASSLAATASTDGTHWWQALRMGCQSSWDWVKEWIPLSNSAGHDQMHILGQSALGLVLSVAAGFGLMRLTEKTMATYRYSEFITAFVILAFLGLALLTETFHLSSELGAFIAGIAMASTHWRHQISAEIHPFRTLLLAIFFVTMGLEVQAWPSLKDVGLILGGLAVVTALKACIVIGCATWFRVQGSLQLGVLVGGCSEFLFMLVPLMKPVLGHRLATGLMMAGVLSMIITPSLFSLCKRFAKPKTAAKEELAKKPQVVIAGFGHVGQTIARILEHNFVSFLVIDYDSDAIQRAKAMNYTAIQGDPRDIEFLKRIRIYESKVLLITFGHLSTTTELVRMLRRKFPDLAICIQVRDYGEASRFSGLGTHVVVPESIESGMQMASVTLQNLGFSQDRAQKMVQFPEEPHFFGVKKP